MEKTLFSHTNKPHILVVDDDDRIRTLLSRFLRDNGFMVSTAKNGNDALNVLKCAYYDALVVDVMMPEKNGIDLTKELRATSDLPILLLTALGEVNDRINGLESGADDYLAKPFEPKELILRLRSILKRKGNPINRSIDKFVIGKWIFLPDEDKLVSDTNEDVRLTSVEVKLLEALARHAGKILSREELARLCGVDGNDRTVDVQITRLRKKIEEDSRVPKYIQTIRGQGYMLKTYQER
ncbi:MAG: response regulator transcription factor [Alphaproteobacteria bacterium]|nr:response regulator transcription factor [Alphaproteobacteria bacterium]